MAESSMLPGGGSGGAGSTGSLAQALEPVLFEATGGRLGKIEWFRSPWQRSGAATGWSTFAGDDGQRSTVLVKLPVGPVEFRWTTELSRRQNGHGPGCTPRVMAAGDRLGSYDLAWVVVEKVDGTPVADRLSGETVTGLVRAVMELHERALDAAPVQGSPPKKDWKGVLARARDAVKSHGLPESQRWNEAIKHVQKALPKLEEKWERRPLNCWCHGDVHPGNAILRRGTTDSCVLLDLGLVHPGHWTEDALYLERQYWGHEAMLGGVKPLKLLHDLRKERHMHCDEQYPMLADVRRVMMGACAPAMIGVEGANQRYLRAALEKVEQILPHVAR